MKHKFIFLCFFFFGGLLAGQTNLVPNPSFEQFTNCPATNSQLNYCNSWVNIYGSITPDYFNSCATVPSGVSLPSNMMGFQNARTGNGYVGVGVYNSTGSNLREFVSTTLTDSL